MTDDTPKLAQEPEDTDPKRVIFVVAIQKQADGDFQIVYPQGEERYAMSCLRDAQDILSQALRERRRAQEHPLEFPRMKRLRLQ